jgi:hypothetical protein
MVGENPWARQDGVYWRKVADGLLLVVDYETERSYDQISTPHIASDFGSAVWID